MTNLRLFSERGDFIDTDTSGMDAATRARFEAVKFAHQAHVEAQDVLAAAYAEVASALKAVENTTAYYDARWPRQTFQDLWRENFGGGPHNRRGI